MCVRTYEHQLLLIKSDCKEMWVHQLHPGLGLVLSGDVAQACRQNQSMLRPPPALRIRQVFATLHQIRSVVQLIGHLSHIHLPYLLYF